MDIYFKFKHINKLVGGFLIVAFVVLVALLIMVARGQKWFEKYTPYTIYFTKGGMLNETSPVYIKDLQAGKVTSVTLTEKDEVQVEIALYKKYADRIREGTEAATVIPFIGASSISLKIGPKENPLIPPGGEIPAQEVAEGDLGELIGSATELIKDFQDPEGDFAGLLKNLNTLTAKFDRAMATMEKRKLYENLTDIVKHVEKITGALDESSPDMQDIIIEARKGLEEANKVILALEKSFLFRGNIEKIMEEDTTLRSQARVR